MKIRFDHAQVHLPLLRQRAFNYRWAMVTEDVIPLTAADPDFPCAPEIVEAIKSYADAGIFSYGPPEGLPAFRQAIAKTVQKRRGIETKAELVLPVDSAAQAIFIVARYCLKAGDEAIIFDPVDFLFKRSIEAAGGIPVPVSIDPQTGRYDIAEIEKNIGPKTKMLCLCNPHNPIGKIYNREELSQLAEIATRHNLWIMNDEIWSDIIFPGKSFVSIASLSPQIAQRTMTIYGFSKTFALAGLRVGYILAPDEKNYEGLMDTSMMRTTAYGVSTLSQIAAQAAYEHCWNWVEDFVAHAHRMVSIAVDRLNRMKGVQCHFPQACYLVFPNIQQTKMSSEALTQYLLENARVAVIPGGAPWFGPGSEGYLRLCVSTSEKILTEALDRIESALARLSL